MAPAAVAIPQFAANNNDSHLREAASSEWNTMESALDFDLLAEYLLEDVGAGGFDFSSSETSVSPTIDALKTQPTDVLAQQDPGVVTPNGGSSFVDDGISQMMQPPQVAVATDPLPDNGDMAGELSQIQQMIAAQQQATALAPARPPQPQQPLQMRPPTQPAAPNNALMGMRHQPPPKPAHAPLAAAPITQRPPAQGQLSQKPAANKRPRVGGAPTAASGHGYSFTSTAPGGLSPALGYQPALSIGGQGSGSDTSLSGRQKSQAQIDRRRERNRILARRTRLRKKFFFESLQKDVADLQRENAALKSIVRSRLRPDDARVILDRCNANERLPSAIHAEIAGMGGAGGVFGGAFGAGDDADPSVKKLDKEDFSLIQSIQNSQQCFIITDPSLHDNPIVYASDDFLTLTGYSQEEVLGRNCRFLQGTGTCRNKVAQIRKAVQAGEDVSVTFVNYTSDGKPFWNSLFVAALRDADNNIVNFIGVIVKVAGPEPGDSEYGKALK